MRDVISPGSTREKGQSDRNGATDCLLSVLCPLCSVLACLVQTHHFAISEGDGDGAIVTAVHDISKGGESIRMAYAYTAGNEVSMMTVSLKNVYCDEFSCEILKIDGVPGTFLANVLDMDEFDRSANWNSYGVVQVRSALSLPLSLSPSLPLSLTHLLRPERVSETGASGGKIDG